jgi:hypothetical protein
MSDARRNVLAFAPFDARLGRLFCHGLSSLRWAKAPSLFLFTRDRPCRSLTGPGISMGTLTMNWQPLTVTQSPIATQIHEALDIHRRFTPQVTLDHDVLVDRLAQPRQFVFHQLMNPTLARDAEFFTKTRRRGPTDTKDIGQCDFDALLRRDVDASYTCHAWNSFVFAPKRGLDP